MTDPATGKKMTKKRILQLFQADQLSQQQVAELEKRGMLPNNKASAGQTQLNLDK